MCQRTGADEVSNRPVTTFSITSSPIIYRAKALAYVRILTSKLLAFHRALSDFKKREKLHFYNKNFKNDFFFPDVFVFNIATTSLSSSYHLIQLFKYYKTMPFSKIRNTGHCPSHKEKHSIRPMLYTFAHCVAIFDWENWNDPFFWFFSFDRAFRVLQNYIVPEDQKYWPLYQPWRKPWKTLLGAFLATTLVSLEHLSMHTGCNKILAPCTLYTKKGIFYFCNRSNRLIYMYVR